VIIDTLKYIALFIFLMIMQLFVINQVNVFINFSYLFQPQIVIMLVLLLPANISHSMSISISFIVGIILDMFLNTMGINASILTLIGFVRYYFTRDIENEISSREEDNKIWTSKKSSTWKYSYFGFFCALYFFVFLFIQNGFRNFFNLFLPALISNTIITFLLILLLENLIYKPTRHK
jgi:hypothetical protein